ncbi:electron transport complex subunit RsxC [Arhodomonas sp. SL1]|uniref:electron transport complex subunit RsxC n=1 Tax=Arhodomonas sp. SL1 TaxID=3425691 RepID=UPI003F8809CC
MKAAPYRFPGGLRLDGARTISTGRPVRPLPLPGELVLPLGEAVGTPGRAVVAAGDRVRAGTVIADDPDSPTAPLHAPVSATVTAIEPRPAPHPSGKAVVAIVLRVDPEQGPPLRQPPLDWQRTEPAALCERIHEAGIAGLGGAAFPTAAKLAAAGERVHTLVLNGVECEPWISCDDMLLRHRAEEVVEGGRILARICGATRCLLAVEEDMPEARAAAEAAAGADVEVVTVPARYPAGGERQLIQALTGEEVPAGALPPALGLLCQNVGTAAAVCRAVRNGEPLTRRYVTVTGDAVTEPRVLDAPLGASFAALLTAAGGTEGLDRLIMGGPMMGFAVAEEGVPVVKGTNCVLAATRALFPPPAPAMPCIRCGACAEACPASLLPQQLYWYARAGDLEQLAGHHLEDCIDCGACAAVCPSHIPLVQYFRHAKGEMAAAEEARIQAEKARARYEARQRRLAREAEERERRRAEKRARLRGSGEGDDRKAAVAAALARRRRRKADTGDEEPRG